MFNCLFDMCTNYKPYSATCFEIIKIIVIITNRSIVNIWIELVNIYTIIFITHDNKKVHLFKYPKNKILWNSKIISYI